MLLTDLVARLEDLALFLADTEHLVIVAVEAESLGPRRNLLQAETSIIHVELGWAVICNSSNIMIWCRMRQIIYREALCRSRACCRKYSCMPT